MTLSSGIQTIHPGCKWWQQRTKKLRDALKLNGKSHSILNIEFFPYHSKNLKQIRTYFSCNSVKLPSAKYVDELIIKAMDEKEPIVVLRMKKMWFERIEGLEEYENLYELVNPRCIYITPNNIRKGENNKSEKPPFEDLLSKF